MEDQQLPEQAGEGGLARAAATGAPPIGDGEPGAARLAAGWTYERIVLAGIGAAIVLRLIFAAITPLAGDELLYWRYSKHLAAGYLDHPVMNPFLIRLGTEVFGDTPFGVRFFVVLLGIPASLAMWRAGELLLASRRAGAHAALMLNLTLAMSVGGMLATSDASVLTASTLVLLALAQIRTSGRGVWWLALGAALGLGMLSKYTTAFFLPGIALWTFAFSEHRKWLATRWPYAGAVIASALTLPVVLWNAEHGWASLIYQSSRMIIQEWSLRYVVEYSIALPGLATPPVFILAVIGLAAGLTNSEARRAWALLLLVLIVPATFYFMWHSLHERVQANWIECVYPALACAAAAGIQSTFAAKTGARGWGLWSMRLATPVAGALALFMLVQSAFGVAPIGRKDPTSRVLAYGWPTLAQQIDDVRARVGAPVVLATEYSLAGQLDYFLPSRTPVQQISDRVRWANEPQPDPSLFTGAMLYVCKQQCGQARKLPGRFRYVELLATFPRMRNGVEIDRYAVYVLKDPIGPVLDPMYPVRLKGSGDDSL